MSIDELRARRAKIRENSDRTLSNIQKITNESYRVAKIAHDAPVILSKLDQEFEEQTGLHGKDILFLFAAVGLQVARIVILNELSKTEVAGSSNRNETKLHEFQEKLLGKLNSGEVLDERPYYASMEHIVTKMGVPYDATATLTQDSINKMLGKGRSWDLELEKLIPTEKLSLFKGSNHRFSTLGHDPILGLIFGTANILTNTITCVKTPLDIGGVGIPVLTTNHVVYTSDYRDPHIATYGSTMAMIQCAVERTKEEPTAFVAALIKQVVHIGTDLYTPCGIQIPGANLVLSNTNAEKLTKYISAGDVVKIGTSAKLAELINLLISALHSLMYDDAMETSRELYSVRTRKIIMYSNVIATGSNVLWVGGNMLAGNESTIKQLDIGGLIVTIKRLISDTEYIRQIKEEFVFGGFKNMIKGKGLELEEVTWDF
ncbi:MAG: hypothetical protein IKY18_00335 [Oscillospiraceae bacterium]|nr:hypothetical protein [Oscillospiraceae bacterium]